jgi:hypothetical protein
MVMPVGGGNQGGRDEMASHPKLVDVRSLVPLLHDSVILDSDMELVPDGN